MLIILVFRSIVMVIGGGINAWFLAHANRKKSEVREKLLAPFADDHEKGNTTKKYDAWVSLGDRHPDFKYKL